MSDKSLKQLALRLYAYPEKDRQWVLSRLEQQQAKQVSALLEDIASHNITDNYQVILESINSAQELVLQEKQTEEVAGLIKQLNRVDQAKLIDCLKEEDSWVLALLFDLYKWKWKDALEQALTANKKMQIKQYLNGDIGKVKDQVKVTVLKIINDMLSADPMTDMLDHDYIDTTIEPAVIQHEKTATAKKSRWWSNLWR